MTHNQAVHRAGRHRPARARGVRARRRDPADDSHPIGDRIMKAIETPTAGHRVVLQAEWTQARLALLAREKAHTAAGDALAKARRELPWVRVERHYVFDTPAGPRTLAELFDGRSQLIVYHFMLSPGWEHGC